ncbi:trimethylamine methyltransferase family protein [Chloroflexota bacterium]
MPREGIFISNPLERISGKQVQQIHEASLQILTDPGLLSYNRKASEIFHSHGAEVTDVSNGGSPCWHVKIPERLVADALASTPKMVKLGARNPDNSLLMHGDEPRVFFITGSETNLWLDVDFPAYIKKSDPTKEIKYPEFQPRRGTVADLCNSAHVCEQLETVDGYIRTVNIQDKDISEDNKDVNKFFASLNNTTKHVMSGLTNLKQLDNVVKMAELIAGGKDELKENPIISFITCLVKSPLQFVDDTTDTFMDVCQRGLPIVVSSSPQAGTSAPIREAGIMAQINAEVLAGITLGQLVNRGTPVIYGSVPVIARMDTLGDSYGAVETSQYNIDCVQMARFYNIPNYSTSGVCDARIPGQQSSIERLFSNIVVALSGPQFLHCAFGLLDCNSVFCLLQAVLDDAHFKRIKFFLKPPRLEEQDFTDILKQIREIVDTPQKMFLKYIRPVMRSGEISPPYPFEGDGNSDSAFGLAYERLQELLAKPVEHIDQATTSRIFQEIPGLLPRLNIYQEGS